MTNIRDSWFVKFMQVLGPGRKAHEVESDLSGVLSINFNYDDALEYFLGHALQLVYGIQPQHAADIVSTSSTHTGVGPLERVHFGGIDHARIDFRELSQAIKTYTERIEEESVLNIMHRTIREAQCIVFSPAARCAAAVVSRR